MERSQGGGSLASLRKKALESGRVLVEYMIIRGTSICVGLSTGLSNQKMSWLKMILILGLAFMMTFDGSSSANPGVFPSF